MISEHSRLIHKFDSCRTAFMLCDVQEKVEPHIDNFLDAVDVANAMSALHQLLGPEHSVFIVTEQYPQGVGHVHPAIQLPPDAVVAEKMQPSMLVPAVRPHIFGDATRGIPPVQQVIIWGHETYGCVLQTADELLTNGIRVAVLVDGCAAQSREKHNTAVLQMSHWEGLMVTTTPSAVMQLTRSDARFMKAIIQVLKKHGADWAATQQRLQQRKQQQESSAEAEAGEARAARGLQPSAWSGMDPP